MVTLESHDGCRGRVDKVALMLLGLPSFATDAEEANNPRKTRLAIAKTTGSPVEKLRIDVMGDSTLAGSDVAAGAEVDPAKLWAAND